jgi:MinD superfamily P-loop ATPase
MPLLNRKYKEDKVSVDKILQSHNRKKEWEKQVLENLKLISGVMAVSINAEFGFGTKRINKLVKRMAINMECIAERRLSEEDVYRWCENKKIKT